MCEKVLGNDPKKVTLIVLPYAGGSSYGFSNWYKEFENNYNLAFIDYAGHGERIKEGLAANFEMLYMDVVEQLSDFCTESAVLFGHSMGGLVCGHVAEEIYKRYGKKFKGIIISGCKAPKYFLENKNRNINDNEIKKYLITERKVPAEIVETKEFLEYIYPAIKNDFRILKNYDCKQFVIPSCPVHCICAENDKSVGIDMMNKWDEYVEDEIVMHKIEGTHFYFEEYPSETFRLINTIIKSII